MVKITKIYTRTGDDGTTGLVGGHRVPKDSLRVETFGGVDELNAHLGVIRTLADETGGGLLSERCSAIQQQLFDLGAELATPPGQEWPGMKKMTDQDVLNLEQWIDEYVSLVPELRSFVLPGGTHLNAALHLARTVCRRVERDIVRLSRIEPVATTATIYLNRLSDLLFAMARHESHRVGAPEYLWQPKR